MQDELVGTVIALQLRMILHAIVHNSSPLNVHVLASIPGTGAGLSMMPLRVWLSDVNTQMNVAGDAWSVGPCSAHRGR